MAEFFTVPDVAELLSVEPWRVRRLFEDKTLAEPPRLGIQRAVPRSMIPLIATELQKRGHSAVTSIRTLLRALQHRAQRAIGGRLAHPSGVVSNPPVGQRAARDPASLTLNTIRATAKVLSANCSATIYRSHHSFGANEVRTAYFVSILN
jgi:hypothetical protein